MSCAAGVNAGVAADSEAKETIVEGIILLALPLTALLLLLLGVAMFVEVAFGPRSGNTYAEGALAQAAVGAVQGMNLAAGLSRGTARPTTCQQPQPVPRVTMLEATAIAAELRQQGPTVAESVRLRAQAGGCGCPLLTDGGVCACQIARPLACVGKCVAGYDVDPGWANGLGEAFSGALRTYLHNHHRDDAVYDLNTALAQVLGEPTLNEAAAETTR